ncbi:DUF1294 domain-containing protein [Pseudomonas sp. MAFF212428]|uniref:DUF1294 domain-containing protein n=1 Tax=Pseudomonas brassicae TaxID=2708063 RepID=A0A6B3NM01_9PSED|nr:DUF1294 domain-containing protein [Pseudomonas brassicae]NER60514.1 DUF1294 domain-containing protein [Pseudomonas brassicae]NER63099.1 DUF1294 domain-containing protein [Pseudomonas brassicae]
MRHARLKLLAFALLCLLPVLSTLKQGLGLGNWLGLAGYALASLACVLLYGYDKRQARAQGQRTPEKVLHAFELLGGWPGALVAQQVFRHKTRKLSYQAMFWGIVLVHQVFWADYLFLAGRVFSF